MKTVFMGGRPKERPLLGQEKIMWRGKRFRKGIEKKNISGKEGPSKSGHKKKKKGEKGRRAQKKRREKREGVLMPKIGNAVVIKRGKRRV